MTPRSTRPAQARHPLLAVLLASSLLGGFAFAVFSVSTSLIATASAGQDVQAMRDFWQGKYRTLLRNRATLNSNLAQLKHDYGQAQRRNYPRGGARQALLEQARQAEQELAKVEGQIETIFTDARMQDVPPGWLYEVEDEKIEAFQPAAPGTAGDDGARADDGRNPLYSKDDDS